MVSSSLLIAGFDVLDPASPVQLVRDGFDRGAPVPSVAEIQSTVLDGAVVSGSAAGNRQPQFTLLIRATSRLALAATTNVILQAVDAQTWTMTFTPDGGMPIVYECFRATSAVSSTLVDDAQLKQQITVKCEALPYGRSPQSQSFTLLATPPVVIDDFSAAPAVNPRSWSTSLSATTAYPYHGANSLLIDPVPHSAMFVPYIPQLTLTKTGLSITAANGITYVTYAVYSPLYYDFAGTTAGSYAAPTWTLSLTVGGVTYTTTSTQIPPSAQATVQAGWSVLQFTFATPIPAGTITAYTLGLPAWNHTAGSAVMVIDYLIAYPATGVLSSSPWGDEFVLPSVLGTARTPVNLAITPPSGSILQVCLHAPPRDTPTTQCLLSLNTLATGTPSVTTNTGVRYEGTYSIYLSVKPNLQLPAAGTVLTITVSQAGYTPPAPVTLAHTISAAEAAFGVGAHSLLYFGEIELPLVATHPQYSPAVTFAPSPTGLSASDMFGDILVLDTRGQTILTGNGQIVPPSELLLVNEATADTGFGPIYSSPTGVLTDAMSIAPAIITGAPMWLYPPGNSRLLVWNDNAAATTVLTYNPRWLQEATA